MHPMEDTSGVFTPVALSCFAWICSEMSVIRRHSLAGFHYAGLTCWVNSSKQALDLKTVEQAIDIARKEKLGGMEIVAKFDTPGHQLVFPIHFNGAGRKPAWPLQAPGRRQAVG
jgi:urease accessory protein UreH